MEGEQEELAFIKIVFQPGIEVAIAIVSSLICHSRWIGVVYFYCVFQPGVEGATTIISHLRWIGFVCTASQLGASSAEWVGRLRWPSMFLNVQQSTITQQLSTITSSPVVQVHNSALCSLPLPS